MNKTGIFQILIVLLLLVPNMGCDGGVTDGATSSKYFLSGGLIKNLDLDSAQTIIYMEKDDSLYSKAILSIGTDTLDYDSLGEIYAFEKLASVLPAGTYTLRAKDLPWLNEAIQFTIPGNFQITSIQLPDDRINNGGDPVPIIWSLALGGDGYFFSVVLKDSAYTTAGYSDFVTTGTASVTIPRDAFQLYSALDTGWYYVYVCSYSGSPSNDYLLPTVIPDGLNNNISKLRLTGRFGAIVVTPHDSIHVALE
ncbi:MAG: hypothetical protein CVT49_06885 [candidate division Zixibacteria bacterium HGW-Zixibacteria-1]|nr:MAG: hypothetical protein CVT49_06885 [candidate division Zixibacteria bacterium HGW-Zixibacteria-1]